MAGSPAVKSKSPVLLTASLYMLMFAYAFSVTMIGPMIPVFMQEYSVSIAQSGLISLFQGLGGAACVFLGIAFADRVKRSLLIKTCFVIYCAAALLLAVAPPYAVLLILFFLIGGSTRLLDAILNAYIADIHPGKRSFYLTLLHAAFGVGALLGPLVSTAFISLRIYWPYIFLALGGFCIFVFVLYMLVQRKFPLAKPEGMKTGLKNLVLLLKNRNIVLLSFLALSYVAFALSCSTWMPSYMEKQLHQDVMFSSMPVLSMWIGIISGRITVSLLSMRFPAKYLLFTSGVVGLLPWPPRSPSMTLQPIS